MPNCSARDITSNASCTTNSASPLIAILDETIGIDKALLNTVHAYTATQARDIEAEDSGIMSLRLRAGGLASINVTMLTYPKNLEGSITVLGERGTVRIGGVAVNDIQHWEFDTPEPGDEAVRAAIERLRPTLPEGMVMTVAFDSSRGNWRLAWSLTRSHSTGSPTGRR